MLGFLNRIVIVFAALLIALVAWSDVLPRAEAIFLPVVSKMSFEEIEWGWNDPNKSAVMVEFTKKRPCEFKTLAWYVNDRWVDVEFNANRGTRPPGDNRTGPWVVSAKDLTNSEVYVKHTCHPFWDVWTKMHP